MRFGRGIRWWTHLDSNQGRRATPHAPKGAACFGHSVDRLPRNTCRLLLCCSAAAANGSSSQRRLSIAILLSASIRRGRLFPENRVKGPGSQVNGEKLRTIALRVGIRRVSGALCAGTNPHECDDFGRLYGETGKNQTGCWSELDLNPRDPSIQSSWIVVSIPSAMN